MILVEVTERFEEVSRGVDEVASFEVSAGDVGLFEVDEEEIEDFKVNFECLLIEVTECFEEDDSSVDEVESFETVLDPLDNVLELIEGKISLFKVLYFSNFN